MARLIRCIYAGGFRFDRVWGCFFDDCYRKQVYLQVFGEVRSLENECVLVKFIIRLTIDR